MAWIGADKMREGDPEGLPVVLGAIVVGGIFAFIGFMWLRWRRFGESVCHLETLPGVIGGWFKASVEVRLPIENPPDLEATLRNIQQYGKVAVVRWESSHRVPRWRWARIQDDRYLVPVRFRIPIDEGRYASGNGLWRAGWWQLTLTAELPGVDFFAMFPVPIFPTNEAPPEEQRPEEDLG